MMRTVPMMSRDEVKTEIKNAGGVWDLETVKLGTYNDKKKFYDDISYIILNDTFRFKYYNIEGELSIQKDGGEINIEWIGQDPDNSIISLKILEDTDTKYLIDENVFDLENNRSFLKDKKLVINNKIYERLNMVTRIRLAILCAFGIRHSIILDAANFTFKLDNNIGTNLRLFVDDNTIQINAMSLRIFQQKPYHSIYGKYGYTYTYDDSAKELRNFTDDFKNMYIELCSMTVKEHILDIDRFLTMVKEANSGTDIFNKYAQSYETETKKRPTKLYNGPNSGYKLLSRKNTKDSWKKFTKCIISMETFKKRSSDYQDKNICEMMSAEYERNKFTYKIILDHIINDLDELWNGIENIAITEEKNTIKLIGVLRNILWHNDLYNIDTCNNDLSD